GCFVAEEEIEEVRESAVCFLVSTALGPFPGAARCRRSAAGKPLLEILVSLLRGGATGGGVTGEVVRVDTGVAVSLPVLPEAIVHAAFLGVRENLVRFVDFLESLLCIGVVAIDVRVEF